MKQIELTKGQFAIVDDEDYEKVNQFNWYAKLDTESKIYYAVREVKTINGKCIIWMHRYIMGLNSKKDNPVEIDHKNHNGLDNRKENLRITDRRGNQQNRRDQSKYGIGVYYCKWKKINPFMVKASKNGQDFYLGVYSTIEKAQKVKLQWDKNNL